MEIIKFKHKYLFNRLLLYIRNGIVGRPFINFVLFCLGVFLSFGAFVLLPKDASASVSLNYENSERNLSPNGTYLNIYTTFRNEDILQRAIDNAGLTGQVSTDELDELIDISIQGLDRAKADSSFVATSYVISLESSSIFGNVSADQMLDQLCYSYLEYFTSLSNHLDPFFEIDITRLSDDEYLLEAETLTLRAKELKRYVDDRIKENKNFLDEEEGIRFLDISGQINEFIDYEVNELTTYIVENGMVRNKEQLLDTLRYRRTVVQMEYDRYKAAYTADIVGLQKYDAAMSAIVLIPSYDINDTYFMDRTNNGVDDLSIQADQNLDYMSYYQSVLDDLDYKLDCIERGKNEPQKRSYTEKNLTRLWDQLNTMSDKLHQVDLTYLQTKNRHCLTYRIIQPDYISIKGLLAYCSVGMAFVTLSVMVTALLKLGKEDEG